SRRAARYFATSSRKLLCPLKKNEPRREVVNLQPGINRCLHITNPVGQREGDFLHRRRTGLADVVARNRNRVPVRHFPRAVRENISDDPQAGLRWIDVSAARDVFLEDVVLYRAVEFVRRDALLSADGDVERE